MMRSFTKHIALALSLALSSLACGGGAPEAQSPKASSSRARPEVPQYLLAQFDVSVHQYPAAAVPPLGFAVSEVGMVLVPVGGGVYAAGWGGWVVEPRPTPVRAVDVSGTALVLAEARDDATTLSRWERRTKVQDLGQLPAGAYQIALTPNDSMWVAGRTAHGGWTLGHAERGGALEKIADLGAPIRALAPAGDGAVVVAMDHRIVLLKRGGELKLLGETKDPVEGVAVLSDGSVLFNTLHGLYRLREGGKLQLLATGIHGPMRAVRGSIYVLRRDKNHVLQLTPPASMPLAQAR